MTAVTTKRPAMPAAPVHARPERGVCGHGTGPCGCRPARLFPVGWRCEPHEPAAVKP